MPPDTPQSFAAMVPEPGKRSPWTDIKLPAGYIAEILSEGDAFCAVPDDHPGLPPRQRGWRRFQHSRLFDVLWSEQATAADAWAACSGAQLVDILHSGPAIAEVIAGVRGALDEKLPDASPKGTAEYIYAMALWDGAETATPGSGDALIAEAWTRYFWAPYADREIQRRASDGSERAIAVHVALLNFSNWTGMAPHDFTQDAATNLPLAGTYQARPTLEEAAPAIVDTSFTKLAALFKKLAPQYDMEALQELLPHLAKHYHGVNPYWLLAAALNGVLNDIPADIKRALRQAYRHEQERSIDANPGIGPDVDAPQQLAVVAREEREHLRRFLGELRDEDQKIIRLSWGLDGREHTLREIIDALGLNCVQSTLSERITKIMTRLEAKARRMS